MKIGILQTGHVASELAEKHGQYPIMFVRMFEGQGLTFETFVVVDGHFPKSVHECDGWLVTGSAHGAYEDHAFIAPLEDFIRAAYESNVPIAGICFGHQIMAQALGGKVIKYPKGWGVGHTKYKMDDKELSILAMHQDQVVEKPEEAVVIASTDFCANAGFAYHGPSGIKAISFQPHPEFTPEFMRDLIRYKTGKGLPKEKAEEALEIMVDENDSAEIAAQLASFFKANIKIKAA